MQSFYKLLLHSQNSDTRSTMWTLLAFFQKNLIYSIPTSMIIGVLVGYFFEVAFLEVLILPLIFLMIYPMMVNLQIKKVLSGSDMKVQLVTQLINFGVIPFLAFGLGQLFFADEPMIALGILLIGLIPSSGMTISWTGFGDGNIDAAMKMTVIGLVLGALLTPFYAEFLMGASVPIPILYILQKIALIVFLPMVAGFLTQRVILWKYGREKYQRDIKKRFPMLSTLGVLGVVAVAMALRAEVIVSQPAMLLVLLIPLILFYVVCFVFSILIAKYFFSKEDGVALLNGVVLRNLSIALAVAMTAFGPEGSGMVLIISLAYIIQVQSAAWYIRYTDRLL